MPRKSDATEGIREFIRAVMPPSDLRDRIEKLLDENKPKKDDPTPRSSS
jgi:hypothetical protein